MFKAFRGSVASITTIRICVYDQAVPVSGTDIAAVCLQWRGAAQNLLVPGGAEHHCGGLVDSDDGQSVGECGCIDSDSAAEVKHLLTGGEAASFVCGDFPRRGLFKSGSGEPELFGVGKFPESFATGFMQCHRGGDQ